MSQRSSSSAPSQIDAMVAESFLRASEAILLDRRATLRPITSRELPEPQEYIRTVLGGWKTSITTPLTLDLYLHLPRSGEHVLLERWQFEYTLQSDLKDTRTFAMINRRVQTLLRSLYCFVRLLPGFNILHQCTAKPLVSFQLYAEQRTIPSNFKQDTSRYQFAKVSTSKGLVAISVTFLNSTPVKAYIKSINSYYATTSTTGSNASAPLPIRRDSLGTSPTLPIPISAAGSVENERMMRTRADSRDLSFNRRGITASESTPYANMYSRSFEGKTPLVDASPFRPNDASHLYSIPRGSPGNTLGGAYYGGGTPIIPIPSNNNRSAASTPVGSYSTPPFAFRQMMEERNSDASAKDSIAQSPPFPPTSSSLTSTSLNTFHAFPERRNSFRRSEGVFSANGAQAVSFTNVDNSVALKPSQLLLPEWQLLRQRLTVPPFPLNAQVGSTMVDTTPSNKLDIVVRMEKEKEKRRGSFDALRVSTDLTAVIAADQHAARNSSDGMRDKFFEKLREERMSFFGDHQDDEDLPFVVPQSELGGQRHSSRSQITFAANKSTEVLMAEFQSQLQTFKQLAIAHQKVDPTNSKLNN